MTVHDDEGNLEVAVDAAIELSTQKQYASDHIDSQTNTHNDDSQDKSLLSCNQESKDLVGNQEGLANPTNVVGIPH